jgi:CheY-like chemotaxis protein
MSKRILVVEDQPDNRQIIPYFQTGVRTPRRTMCSEHSGQTAAQTILAH